MFNITDIRYRHLSLHLYLLYQRVLPVAVINIITLLWFNLLWTSIARTILVLQKYSDYSRRVKYYSLLYVQRRYVSFFQRFWRIYITCYYYYFKLILTQAHAKTHPILVDNKNLITPYPTPIRLQSSKRQLHGTPSQYIKVHIIQWIRVGMRNMNIEMTRIPTDWRVIAVRVIAPRFILPPLHTGIVSARMNRGQYITEQSFPTVQTPTRCLTRPVHYRIEVDARKQEGDITLATRLSLPYRNKFSVAAARRKSNGEPVDQCRESVV